MTTRDKTLTDCVSLTLGESWSLVGGHHVGPQTSTALQFRSRVDGWVMVKCWTLWSSCGLCGPVQTGQEQTPVDCETSPWRTFRGQLFTHYISLIWDETRCWLDIYPSLSRCNTDVITSTLLSSRSVDHGHFSKLWTYFTDCTFKMSEQEKKGVLALMLILNTEMLC